MPDMPASLRYARVDEIIECHTISDATIKNLCLLMPHAYDGEESSCTEPDSGDPRYRLFAIWDDLTETSRQDIILSVNRD